MKPNTISVTAYLVNGQDNEVLSNATAKDAIEQYLFPDSGAPVQTISISLCDKDGKEHLISIYPGGIVVRNPGT